MYGIAAQVASWLDDGREVTMAQVVATRGFSSRDPAAAAAWTPGLPPIGAVLEGIDIATLVGRGPGLVELTISDAEAVQAGLACGGAASVLVTPASALPTDLWGRLVDRDPVCLVTELDGAAITRATAYAPDTVRSAGETHGEIPRLFGRGISTTALLDDTVAVVALWPVPTLVVVGDGLIADALVAAGDLLGWTSLVTPDVTDAVAAIDGLHRSDAVVVLSHSRDVDGPVLSAALATPSATSSAVADGTEGSGGSVGYVGALGSRHTQAARREWLTERGVPDAALARIHGPAGLDLDAHTPGEIAVSIVAEILAERGHGSGRALRDRPGPVHTDGVQAPPPRY
ncbi:XdhC family protein [Jatrophihabitans endophyticus]|uniref:XdhC family protein n=1 Tax=Jatrophihabitans endophyticus TaxID=1206085 RepID=UPI0019FEBF69|nr:XdhC/CoxI family protein [Jatrophihabitans endophyticus]MBE7188096.1 XdhC family protein [Jatrophihabitans endophyticus]